MPRNDRGLPWRQFAFHHMQVRAAYAASIDAHEQFAFTRLGGGNILVMKRIAFHLRRRLQNTRFHRETPRAATARSTYSLLLPGPSAKCCTLDRRGTQTNLFTGIIQHLGTIES